MTALTRRQRWELLAVLMTAATHLACFGDATVRPLYLAAAIGGWGIYGAWTAIRHPDVARAWGFTRERLGPAAAVTLAFTAVSAAGLAAIGAAMGTLAVPWTLLVILVTYPVWGWVQQWLVQGVVARALDSLPRPYSHPAAVTVVAAAVFGLVHWPFPALMVATFGLGLVVTPLYLRYRNLGRSAWPTGGSGRCCTSGCSAAIR